MLNSYHFISIIFFTLLFYLFSFILVKKGKLKLMTHCRLWNYILLISFLISGFLGLVLTFFIENKLSVTWYREILWLHVESGVVMALLSIIHIIWHWRYFFRRCPQKK